MKEEHNSKSEELVRGEETQIYMSKHIQRGYFSAWWSICEIIRNVFPAIVSLHQKK